MSRIARDPFIRVPVKRGLTVLLIMKNYIILSVQSECAKYDQICEAASLNAKKETAVRNSDWLDSPWSGFFETKDPMKLPYTGIDCDQLAHIGDVFSGVPDDFKIHTGKFSLYPTLCRASVAQWRALDSGVPGSKLACASCARPTPLKCKNEYLVLALVEETAVRAVVGFIVWRFAGSKSQGVGR